MALTKEEIQQLADIAAQRAVEAAGITSGMISEREAGRRFGAWFKNAVKARRISPAQIGVGKGGTRRYQLSDILILQAADKQQARVQLMNAARNTEQSFV